MTAFRYRALDAASRETIGIIEADTGRAARGLLRERALFPLEVSGVDRDDHPFRHRRRLGGEELALLTRQWSTLLASGLTVERALAALAEQTACETQRQLLAAVRSEILVGHSLRAALDCFPRDFPAIYRASVAAGEESGGLAIVMEQLADYLEHGRQLRQKTLQALLYPLIVTSVAVLVMVGLMTYVVPQVVAVFQQGKQALPWLTRTLIVASDLMRDWGGPMLLALIMGAFASHHALRREWVRRAWHVRLLRTPLLGRYLRGLEAARFASTLAILASSGVPLMAALEAGRQVLALLPLREAVASAANRVREGQPLSRALAATGQFPPLLGHMIASGESTGRLGDMLERAARVHRQEVENRIATLTTILEPLLLLGMGGLVLLIVLAVMQPIIEINTLMK